MVRDPESEASSLPRVDLTLASLIDAPSTRALIQDFHELTGHVMSIVDTEGNFFVRVGWQDACTRFHRANAASCALCHASDIEMAEQVARGEARSYLCENGLWHVVTPLFVGEHHVGNVFTSQFFFDDQEIDFAAFEARAERFGFDREDYLATIRAVPRYSRETIALLMRLYSRFAEQLAMLGMANFQLAETMEAREKALEARVESESLLRESQRVARVGHYSWDIATGVWACSEVLAEIFGIDDSYTRDLEGWGNLVALDDREMMLRYVKDEVIGARRPFDKEYRITRVRDGALRWVHGLGDVVCDEEGNPLKLFGIIQDITDRRRVDAALTESRGQLERMVYEVAEAMGRVIEARDPYTQGHQQRVAGLAKRIATRLGLSQSGIDEVEMAGLLHDVGKLRTPSEILTKPGRLSTNEFALVKSHPEQGFEIIKGITFPWNVADAVLQHHERLDGSGYPAGLKGDEIRGAARILAVADVVEAMASHRPYRPTLGVEAAIEEIVSNPAKFDREVVAACVSLYEGGQLGL